jgi:hypothetical protein
MPAIYCKNKVIGSSFACTVIVCLIFLISPVATVITTFEFIGVKTYYLAYIPLFLVSGLTIYLFFLTTLTDPGVFPRTS